MKGLITLWILFFTSFLSLSQTEEIETNKRSNYIPNQAIIRLNWKFLDLDVIDDPKIISGDIYDFLNTRGLDYLKKNDVNLFDEVVFIKSFPHLSTTDTISIGRLGNVVPMPSFWSVFKIVTPKDLRLIEFIERVNHINQLVVYCHPNYIGQVYDIPNDSLIGEQWSVVPGPFPDAHINVDSAWNYTVGKPFIKVGVYDTGIDTTHPDIEVVGGKGFYTTIIAYDSQVEIDPNLQGEWGVDDRNHGTAVAGIIGATRNNGIGIAGIAGGDGTDTTGISLFDMNQSEVGYPGLFNGGDFLAENHAVSVIDGARSVGTYYDWQQSQAQYSNSDEFAFSQGFGLHVANHSLGFVTTTNKEPDSTSKTLPIEGGGFDDPIEQGPDCQLCKEAWIFSNENGVINVVARGNSSGTNPTVLNGPDNHYPQGFQDQLLISVGGNGYDGNVMTPSNNSSSEDQFASMIGRNVDLIAPSTDSIVISLSSSQASPNLYRKFNGTSASAPHVTGAVALLLSYYNKDCYSNYNLDIEDVEQILQRSATDVQFAGYDSLSGWGRLDVSRMIDSLKRPYYQIVHPDSSPINRWHDPVDSIVIEGNLYTNYGPYSNEGLVDIEASTKYVVERYKVYETYDFSSYTGGTIEFLDAWPRKNLSKSARFVNDTVQGPMSGPITYDKLELEREAIIESVSSTSITLSGYVYNFVLEIDPGLGVIPIMNTGGNNVWFPTDTVGYELKYSLYLRDTINGIFFDFPCTADNPLIDTAATVAEMSNNLFEVFPNPNNGKFTVKSMDLPVESIVAYDMEGKILEKFILSEGIKEFEVDLSNVESGIYNLRVKFVNDQVQVKKIIIQ